LKRVVLGERVVGNQITSGSYVTESHAVASLDAQLKENFRDLFGTVHKEVCGEYRHILPGVDAKRGCRIDRVVMPSTKLRNLGWRLGPIFIEVKKSGTKVGSVVSQCMDYRRAVFEIIPGYWVEPQWVFIYPLGRPHGDLASVMAQNCIGAAELSKYTGLTLRSGNRNALEEEGSLVVDPGCGHRIGSR